METESLVRFTEVSQMTGLSRSTIWRLEHQGDFPKRLQISPRSIGWKRSEIEGWIAEREEAGTGGRSGRYT